MAEIDVTRRGTTEQIIERPTFRLSWGAVFAGLVVALALEAVFTLLGTAIGLTALDPGEAGRGLGIGAAIWLIVTVLVSLYVGGLVTGRLAGVLTRGDGALHGILMWGLSTILALYLLASGVSSLLGGAMQLASSGAAATAGTVAQGGRGAQRVDSAARSMMDTIQANAGEVISDTREGATRGAWLALVGLALSAGAAALGAAQKAHE